VLEAKGAGRLRAAVVCGAVALLACAARAEPGTAAGRVACPPPAPDPAYDASVNAALAANQDVWGNELLAEPGGPTYAGAARYLRPLMLAGPPSGSSPGRLSESGVYYLAFGRPAEGPFARSIDLHVADGSQIVSERATGAHLSVDVGTQRLERYGSCLARLDPPKLGGGYLPILDTSYEDASGVRYTQESFATRIRQTRSLVSFVRLTVDPRGAGVRSARIHLTASLRGLHRAGNRLDLSDGKAALLFSPGARLGGRSLTYSTPGNRALTVYAVWLAEPAAVRPFTLGAASYAKARRSVRAYWNARLAVGASFAVPERRVQDAERNLLIQDLLHLWRYSLGNRYERFSWEQIDVGETLGAYGFTGAERAILQRSFSAATVFPNRSEGDQMIGVADYWRRTGDDAFVDQVTPAFSDDVDGLAYELDTGGNGLLWREPYGVDIPKPIYGLHDQALVFQGLRGMADVWAATGHLRLSARATMVADRLEVGLRAAVAAAETSLPDGSLFIPVALLDPTQHAFDALTASRDGSYWNLVMPFALYSGLFRPGSPELDGTLAYMLDHGSRLLGLVRFRSFTDLGKPGYRSPGSDDVYGINSARVLADAGQDDQLVLSLYGKLAAGMTQNTFVAGEGSTIGPVAGEYFRSMFRPPNSPNNATFLETLRLLLVHETRDALGTPDGLELAFATPRAWLEPGKRIAVRRALTSFGRLSYTLEARAGEVHAVVDVPARVPPQKLRLRLRLPDGKQIEAVSLDGKAFHRFAPETGTIDLSGLHGRLDLLAVTS
jgi:hypothetical protein